VPVHIMGWLTLTHNPIPQPNRVRVILHISEEAQYRPKHVSDVGWRLKSAFSKHLTVKCRTTLVKRIGVPWASTLYLRWMGVHGYDKYERANKRWSYSSKDNIFTFIHCGYNPIYMVTYCGFRLFLSKILILSSRYSLPNHPANIIYFKYKYLSFPIGNYTYSSPANIQI